MQSDDAGAERGSRSASRGGPWTAAGANLLLGVFAIFPAVCIHWLVTHYLEKDCAATGGAGCDQEPDMLGSFYLEAAVASGLAVLAMTAVVDFLMPRQEGWPLRTWLGMTVLIPVPFFAGLALGRF
ncbi:hypothetical protein AB0N93_03875 [Streptomyces sp. NPDC091267]|uniref:hypothetical protein n=1 Tax=Streptomyces sp. NPDC091267 TaxID=3155195 RepID=UPI0034433DB8